MLYVLPNLNPFLVIPLKIPVVFADFAEEIQVAFNAAVASCQGRDWRNAVALLEEHPAPDAASFGACISACEKSSFDSWIPRWWQLKHV